MRVGVVMEQALAAVSGGTGRYSVELAAALARTAGVGDEVTGWTAWHRRLGPARVAGVSGPHRLALPRRPLIVAWERGAGPVPSRCDVVHTPTSLVPPRHRRPLVVTIHDTVPWTHPETLTSRGVHWHRAMAERAADTADAIVVPTRAVATELASFVPGLRPDRIHALGAGVASIFTRMPDETQRRGVAARYGLPARYLLSLATLEPRKGLDLLVAAQARVGAAALPLVVAGAPGWGGVDLAELVRAQGLPPDAVRALGRVPDVDLPALVAGAQALVMPSRAEGFGLPLIEAMAMGTAVVCTDVPALVEVAGDAAIVVAREDVDALARGLTEVADEGVRVALVRAGRARSLLFDWDEVARRAWQLYRDLEAGVTSGPVTTR